MVSDEKMLSYPDWKLPFTVHTDASDKQLGAIISHNNKHIDFFLRILIKPHRNYTNTEKELLTKWNALSSSKEFSLAMK